MEKFEIIITTLFGLESLVAREVRRLGYETTSVEDGRVTFMGDLTNCLKRQKLLIGVNGLAKMTLFL